MKELTELQSRMRSKDIPCQHCDSHPATDIHHVDGNHGNNTPSNLVSWCKRCHNEHHGISDNLTTLSLLVRMLYTIQRDRIAMGNRVAAYNRLGYDVAIAQDTLSEMKDLEQRTSKNLTKMLKHEPCYHLYLSKIKGVGPKISGVLLSELGDPGRFSTISALWAYCGLDVRDGEARKRRKGEKANWNSTLRSACARKLTDQFIKLKGHDDCLGRTLYDRYKTFYTERDGDTLSKGHIDNRARRKVAKVFLSCLWLAWRQIKGLPVTEPYAAAKLEHTHIVTPADWAGQGWLSSHQPLMRELDPMNH